MWNYQINIHTNPHPSVSSTVSSIPTLMKCTFPNSRPLTVVEADPSVSTSSTKRGLLCLVVSLSFRANVDMINIFEVFLPQLLRYPNPADPLNGDAAVLLLREPKTYESKVRDYVSRYATREAVEEMDNSEDSEYEMSDAEMTDDDEDELAGQMELS
jgi:hypothetical protein